MAQVLKSLPAAHLGGPEWVPGSRLLPVASILFIYLFFQINLFERQSDMGEGKGEVLHPLVHSPKMPSRAGAGPGCIRVSRMGGRGPSTAALLPGASVGSWIREGQAAPSPRCTTRLAPWQASRVVVVVGGRGGMNQQRGDLSLSLCFSNK